MRLNGSTNGKIKIDDEVHGPYSSQQMMEWQEAEFFKAGVFCRKVGTDGAFYNSRRIDFELYTWNMLAALWNVE